MKNKNSIIYIIFLIFIISILSFLFVKYNSNQKNSNYASKENTDSNYEANRTSSSLNNSKTDNNNTNEISENTDNDKNNNPQVTEEQISTFSTKIYSTDSARQNNILITCNTLNGTIIKNGDTFSFCNTVGQATTSKGYQKADIFDSNGKKKKGLGGGNCQISTTLYNAVLKIPELTITERHEHSNYVPYIEKGKDAAVAYGSYDFKFVNHTGNDIKIYAEASNENVTINIVSLKTI